MKIRSSWRAVISSALVVLVAVLFTAVDADAARKSKKGKEKRGTLSKKQINKVLNDNKATVWGCYEDAKTRKEGAEGTVTITWKVYPDGHVEDPEVVESTLDDADAETCMVKELKLWQFPEPQGEGIVVITIPFNFKYIAPEPEPEAEAGGAGGSGEAGKDKEGGASDDELLGGELEDKDKDKDKGKKKKKSKKKKAKKKKAKKKKSGDVW